MPRGIILSLKSTQADFGKKKLKYLIFAKIRFIILNKILTFAQLEI
jgi:hypothetical protein